MLHLLEMKIITKYNQYTQIKLVYTNEHNSQRRVKQDDVLESWGWVAP